MNSLQNCEYSAFISYSHGGDKAHGGWITHFTEQFYEMLKGRVGRAMNNVLPRPHLSGKNGPVGGLLDQELKANLAKSFAMIIVVEEDYCASGWCQRELEYFQELFGRQGFEERLYIIAMSKPAADGLTGSDHWKRHVPANLVYKAFYRDDPIDRPIPIFNDRTGALMNDFQDRLDAILRRLVDTIERDFAAPPRPAAPAVIAPAAPAAAGARPALLIGVPAPEYAPATAAFAADLRRSGVPVQELEPQVLQGRFEVFDTAGTLILPLGAGGQHLAPFMFQDGGHLAAQRAAWEGRNRPADGLLWLDLRSEPVSATPDKGHAELLAAVGHKAVAAKAMLAQLAPPPAPVAAAAAAEAAAAGDNVIPINLYIENNQNERLVWMDLAAHIKDRWRELLKTYPAGSLPPMNLRTLPLSMLAIDEVPLHKADGVVLLWGQKDEASLRAQVTKMETRLQSGQAQGIVAYLMPHREVPKEPPEAAYWMVLQFKDANSRRIHVVQEEVDLLNRFLADIIERKTGQQPVDIVLEVQAA